MHNGVIAQGNSSRTWMMDGQKAVRWRRPARATEAVTGPSLLSWECRHAQSHRTRPKEAQGPSAGPQGGGGGESTMPPHAPRDSQLVNMLLEASVDI